MPTAHEILKSVFGYDSFRPMQEEIIEHVVSRKDALVLMPTGGGKSICYQIPALLFKGITVFISPLISLMKDQVDALNANGIGADALNSNNEEGENAAIRERCKTGQTKILYISPERLQREIPWMQQHLNVSLFAIDEAHCISQWGHDFRPEYTQLGGLHQAFPSATVMALTATADKLTKEDIVRQLNLRDFRLFVSSFDRPNLSLDVRRGYSASEKLKAILSIISKHKHESGIIYCLSRKNTEKVAADLINAGVYAKAYHAGLTAEERNNVQEDFINDNIDVVCATIALEIGRAGRDGLPSETVLFYNFQDIITLRKFVNESGQRGINSEKLNRMQEYAESQVCRRRILLNYFGENNSSNCGNCDICKHPPQRFNGTILVQKALSAIKRTGEHIGFSMTADILKGTLTDEIAQKGYNKLKTFGVGSGTTLKHWHDYMLQMLQLGYIEIAYNENNHLKITESGNEVLFGKKTAELAIAAKAEAKEDAKPRSSRAAFSRTSAGNTHSTYARSSDSDEDNSLFEVLRKVRRQIANENNWPAYVVLSDRTLKDLAYKTPITIDELQDVFGFGEMKIRKFGQQFVDAICDYMRQQKNPAVF